MPYRHSGEVGIQESFCEEAADVIFPGIAIPSESYLSKKQLLLQGSVQNVIDGGDGG